MRAAEKLFARRRLHEITLDDVVHEARVGKGTVYRYFQDKDDLFFETATKGFDELCALLTREVPADAPFGDQLLAACRQISDFFARRRRLFRMMQAEEARLHGTTGPVRRRWRRRRKKLVAAVAAILRSGVAEGKIRDDVPTEILANFLLGMLRTRSRNLGDVPESSRPFELVVELFCRGAGAAAPGGGRRRRAAMASKGVVARCARQDRGPT
jgi:AcrR family transcriptional regulator